MKKLLISAITLILTSSVTMNTVIANANEDKTFNLPNKVVEKLKEHNTNVNVLYNCEIENKLNEKNRNCVGICQYKEEGNIIFVEDKESCSRSRDRILYHELGHSFDKFNYNGNVYTLYSETELFEKAYSEEKDQLFDENNAYYRSCISEYFAECFSMYFYSEDTRTELKNNAPMSFEYIERIVK